MCMCVFGEVGWMDGAGGSVGDGYVSVCVCVCVSVCMCVCVCLCACLLLVIGCLLCVMVGYLLWRVWYIFMLFECF